MMSDEFWKRVTDFFSEYVFYGENATLKNGNLSRVAVAAAAEYLIENDVFSDYNDLRMQALKDYGILIPMDVLTGRTTNEQI